MPHPYSSPGAVILVRQEVGRGGGCLTFRDLRGRPTGEGAPSGLLMSHIKTPARVGRPRREAVECKSTMGKQSFESSPPADDGDRL